MPSYSLIGRSFAFAVLIALLAACGLIPDQKFQDAVPINGEQVPLTTNRRVYIDTTLANQPQQISDEDCDVSPMPVDCIMSAETPSGEQAVVTLKNFEQNIPINPRVLEIGAGLQSILQVVVPEAMPKELLPQTMTLSEASIVLNMYDGNFTAEEIAYREADFVVSATATPNGVWTLSTEECTSPAELQAEGLKACSYTGSGMEDVFRSRVNQPGKLKTVLGKNSNPGATITGAATLSFNNLEGGDFALNGVVFDPTIVITLSGGDIVAKF